MATPICETVAPAYEHDCDECEYLGTTTPRGMPVDHYWCSNCALPTGSLIQRFGREGSDYSSIPVKIYRTINAKQFSDTYEMAADRGLVRVEG